MKEEVYHKNNEEAEECFYKQKALKEELYKKTMNLSEEEYKSLTHNILLDSRNEFKNIAMKLTDLSEPAHCWDCNHLMCYECVKKLENAQLLLQDVASKHNIIV